MFFFFGSEYDLAENSNSLDLDIFLYDSSKIIHISTAGMKLINSLNEINYISYTSNIKRVLKYRRKFISERNNILERDNLTSLESYFYFFNLMAKRGFYSYDKVDINNPDDYEFQLISRPILNKKILINNEIELGNLDSLNSFNYDLSFIKSKKDFPLDFKPFDINDYV
jgi:hypothetical protein